MQRMLYGLGYPQTNGKCWLPPVGDKPGRWTDADPLAECTYAPPAVANPTAAATGLWSRIPLWVKAIGGAALAFAGYRLVTKRR